MERNSPEDRSSLKFSTSAFHRPFSPPLALTTVEAQIEEFYQVLGYEPEYQLLSLYWRLLRYANESTGRDQEHASVRDDIDRHQSHGCG